MLFKFLNCGVCVFVFLRRMATSKRPMKVSEERVQMYVQQQNKYLSSASISDGDHEPEVDPYAFEDGDVKFFFPNERKDKSGREREPGKKHKVGLTPDHYLSQPLSITFRVPHTPSFTLSPFFHFLSTLFPSSLVLSLSSTHACPPVLYLFIQPFFLQPSNSISVPLMKAEKMPC